jgi:glycosyltransferase involved in cell wall biosynthesis
MTENLNVSVIIPTYNRHKLLIEVLPSYLKQKHVHEIIIIDDGSDIPLNEIIDDNTYFDDRIRIFTNNRSLGLCNARNQGVMEATSNWIFFGEDDLVLSDNHIENIHRDRIQLDADMICGNLIQQEFGESLQESYERVSKRKNVSLFNHRLMAINYGTIKEPIELPFSHAIFMAPTEVVKKYLFSTRIGGPSFLREDLEFQLTARTCGYRLFATPNATAYHYAKSKSHGSGTRLNIPIFVYAASAAVNTWQVLNQHYEVIAPFFGNISKKKMIRKAIFWTVLIEIKRRIQTEYTFVDKSIRVLRKCYLNK